MNFIRGGCGFFVDAPNSSVWFHVVFNFLGLNNNQAAIAAYHDGVQVGNNSGSAISIIPDLFRAPIAVGVFNGWDRHYTSMQIDELVFFNRALTEDEIRILSQSST